jgi:hypothetical protein
MHCGLRVRIECREPPAVATEAIAHIITGTAMMRKTVCGSVIPVMPCLQRNVIYVTSSIFQTLPIGKVQWGLIGFASCRFGYMKDMGGESTVSAEVRAGFRHALDRYFLLLLMILATIAASSVMQPQGWRSLLLTSLQSATALLAVSTSDSPRSTRRFVAAIVVLAFGLVALSNYYGDPALARAAFAAGNVVLVAIVPVTVLRRLAHHRRVTVQTVMGVLCIYLLVGLLFAVFMATYQHFAGAFFSSGPTMDPSEFIYFSFITLTTVGYGDLAPADAFARVLAVSEALIGQLYLVTVVALTVSNIGLRRRGSTVRQHDQYD